MAAVKTDAQLAESIDRFQRVFRGKQPDGRPPVGVVNPDVCLPVKYLRRQTEQLAADPPRDCWISPTILRGASDVLAALRGLTDIDFLAFLSAARWRNR